MLASLYRDRLVRLVASVNRYLGLPQAGDGLTVAGSTPKGAAHLIDG